MGVFKIQINNGEKVTDQGVTIYDKKGKPIVGPLPDGWQVKYTASQDPSTIAQFVQTEPNQAPGTITTEGDDVGVVTFTADVTRPDGSKVLSKDGSPPQLEVTVINSEADTAEFSTGTVQPE